MTDFKQDKKRDDVLKHMLETPPDPRRSSKDRVIGSAIDLAEPGQIICIPAGTYQIPLDAVKQS